MAEGKIIGVGMNPHSLIDYQIEDFGRGMNQVGARQDKGQNFSVQLYLWVQYCKG